MMCPEAEVALWLGAIDVVLGAGQDRHSGLLATCVATTLLDDPVAWTVANDPELPVRLAETLRAQGLGCPPVLVRLLRSRRSGAEGCMSAILRERPWLSVPATITWRPSRAEAESEVAESGTTRTHRGTKRATRRSRTGDLLITSSDRGETPRHQEEVSPEKTEDHD